MNTVHQIKFNALVASANYQFVSAAADHTNIPHELEDAFMHAYSTMLTNVHVGQAALPAVLETWIPFSATPELLADFFTRMGFAGYIPIVQTMLDGFKGADLEIRTGGYLAGMDTAAQTIVSEEYHYNQNDAIEKLCRLYKLKHTPVWSSLSEDFKRQVVKIQAEKAQHFLPVFETFKTGLEALQAEIAQSAE
jgi:hypothetical protein